MAALLYGCAVQKQASTVVLPESLIGQPQDLVTTSHALCNDCGMHFVST